MAPSSVRSAFRLESCAGARLAQPRSGRGPAPGKRPLRPVPLHAHRAGQRTVRQADLRGGVEVEFRHVPFAELVLAGHRPQRAPVRLARAGQARKRLLFPDHQIHEPCRTPVDRRVPGLFEARKQDPRLRPFRFAPENTDLAHPLDDMGPLQQRVAGLPRRGRGIAGPTGCSGGVAGCHKMPQKAS